MKILLLCDRVPDSPSDGLLLRVLALAKVLAEHHSIDVLCLRQPGQTAAAAAGLFGRVWIVQAPPRPPPPGWWAPLMGWGPDALYVAGQEVKSLLQSEINPDDYDVIWDAGAVLLAQLPPRWDEVPVVADLVDDMVLTYWRAFRAERRLAAKLRLLKYTYLFGRFERDVMRRAASCVVVGEEDAATFERVSPHVPVHVVPNGVDTDFYRFDGSPEVPGRIVFEGTMSFPPNEQAAIHLVQQIMPLVWDKRPDVTVSLVGRDPTARVKSLASDRVVVTGSVPDVRPHVLAAEVFVCPLLSGAGIKNKLLQAWAMQRAVLATTLSIGGLDARNGVDLVVEDATERFAAELVSLLADPARRQRMAVAGRAVTLERFAWRAMGLAFQRLLESAVAGGRRQGRVL